MERLTNKREADAQREEYERRLANGYPRNIPEERFLRLAAYEDTGLTPEEAKRMSNILLLNDRLREFAEADKDGRLVVLPCKVGDTVYRIFNPPSREPVISAHTLMSVDYIVRWIDKFGKTVFLTREEAEKALEAMKDE
jgi:hypothetical protein|nr:MAG TPA: hypothetical protein [Caudoviricetes sp.]